MFVFCFLLPLLVVFISSENKLQHIMASEGGDNFLVCPVCEDEFEVEGDKQPMSLHCGHTFCSGRHFSLNSC